MVIDRGPDIPRTHLKTVSASAEINTPSIRAFQDIVKSDNNTVQSAASEYHMPVK